MGSLTARPKTYYSLIIYQNYFLSFLIGGCWDVRQCFVRQFKTEYARLLEGLVFEKKKEREREREREKVEQNINRTSFVFGFSSINVKFDQ
jgi:hypothetical protein